MNKLIQGFLLVSVGLLLSTCSSLLPELKSELPLQKSTDKMIELAPHVQLQLTNIWPLKGKGTMLRSGEINAAGVRGRHRGRLTG